MRPDRFIRLKIFVMPFLLLASRSRGPKSRGGRGPRVHKWFFEVYSLPTATVRRRVHAHGKTSEGAIEGRGAVRARAVLGREGATEA